MRERRRKNSKGFRGIESRPFSLSSQGRSFRKEKAERESKVERVDENKLLGFE